jgi:hypothetical protein
MDPHLDLAKSRDLNRAAIGRLVPGHPKTRTPQNQGTRYSFRPVWQGKLREIQARRHQPINPSV